MGTYKHLSTLATPVTEASIRADLETSQVQPFTNEGWALFVGQMSNLPLDDSLLTAAEASIVNTFREVIEPDPALDCCGVVVVVDGVTLWSAIPRIGSATWEHEIILTIPDDTDCNIKSIDANLFPSFGSPNITTVTPFKTLFTRCENSKRYFSKFWVEFAADPSGLDYNFTNLDFKDADDITITTFAPASPIITMP
jgi:hypothetical protein